MNSMHFILLAQAASDLLPQLTGALQLIMMFGFIAGTLLIIKGGYDVRRGEDGKSSILGGILIAAAPAVMYALYLIFGLAKSAIPFK